MMSTEKKTLRKTKGHFGQRKRRIRRVTQILLAILIAGSVLGIWYYRATRPETRRPGEALDDITEGLSKDLPGQAPMPSFKDVTVLAGLADFNNFEGSRTSQLPEDMGAGVAWGDFDQDGDEDVFLVSAGGTLTLPPDQVAESQLFENLGDGTFRRYENFPETRIFGMGAAWGDYDADGRLDLAVSGYKSLLLFHNEGDRFVLDERFEAPEGYWSGISWADFDNDRDLDLYVCGYVKYVEDAGSQRNASDQYGRAVPYTLNPASFDPERNLLFQNDGKGNFEEVAELYGVSNPDGRSLGALWHDFDQDGRLDLYIANDISDNALYMNRGETFEDKGLTAWVADYRGAMGLAAGDWNRDGDDDLFVTHWLAQENALYDSRFADMAEAAAAGAVPLTFSDLASPLGLGQIALHMVGWGTEFADLDADGWLDLLVSNGSTLETDSDPPGLKAQSAMFLWNEKGEFFHDLARLSESLASPRVGRGLALADFDLDGDLDILKVNLYEGVQLLRNDMPQGNWLQVQLRNRTGETFGRGEGTTVVVRSGDLELRRSATGASYLSQSTRTLHFGLGEAQGIDNIEIEWLGGETQSLGPVELNAIWRIEEGGEPERQRSATSLASSLTERERLVKFWETQRAAMDAIKIENDIPKAVGLLRAALELNPEHGDSRYYLANCLNTLDQPVEALEQLDIMRKREPQSHRAWKQWGVLRALTAISEAHLEEAEASLERALAINKEGAGALMVLGELSILRGDDKTAKERLSRVSFTNPKATGGFFLQGYLAWKDGDREAASAFLSQAVTSRGPDWVPEGSVAEGDVEQKMHSEASPLARFWDTWDGNLDPDTSFRPLDTYLKT